jgi:hypothetical protein
MHRHVGMDVLLAVIANIENSASECHVGHYVSRSYYDVESLSVAYHCKPRSQDMYAFCPYQTTGGK